VSEAPEKKSHRKLWIWLAVLALLALSYVGYRWYWSHQVSRRLAQIRADGYPTTAEELNAWYPQPKGENAADIYDSAADAMVSVPYELREKFPILGEAILPKRWEPLSAEVRTMIEEYLAKNAKVLELAHRAAAVPECRFKTDLSGTGLLLPSSGRVRRVARLLLLDAIVRAEKDDAAGAIKSLCSALGTGRALRPCPSEMLHFVRIACDAIAIYRMGRVFTRCNLTDAQLVALDRALERADYTDSLRRALAGERCTVNIIYERIANGQIKTVGRTGGDSGTEFQLMEAAGWLDQDRVFYLDYMAEAVAAASLPTPARLDKLRRLSGELNEYFDNAGLFLRARRPVSMELLLHVGLVTSETEKIRAQLQAARILVAALRYKLVAGKLPDALADLAPKYLAAVPADPFDGKPFRYKQWKTGCVVYSVCVNKVDDGGSNEIDLQGNDQLDMGVSWGTEQPKPTGKE
jgi:hypothetical protein